MFNSLTSAQICNTDIAPASLSAIVKALSKPVYITQEVVDSGSSWVDKHESAGDVQEFRFAYTMLSAFKNGIANLKNVNNDGFLPSAKANVFVTNHDTERGGSSLNYNSPSVRSGSCMRLFSSLRR